MNFLQNYVIKFALNFASDQICKVDEATLTECMVAMGRAFGPQGIQHWSELGMTLQDAIVATIPGIGTDHKDWEVFKGVSRRLTFFVGPPASWIAGNTTDQDPIPRKGEWFVQQGYFAFTTKKGVHFRIGFRLDNTWNDRLAYLFGEPTWVYSLSVSLKDVN